jgi:hypothetical protein
MPATATKRAMRPAITVNDPRVKEKARKIHRLEQERGTIVDLWNAREAMGFTVFSAVAPLDNAACDYIEREIDRISREIASEVVWEVIGRAEYRLERAS